MRVCVIAYYTKLLKLCLVCVCQYEHENTRHEALSSDRRQFDCCLAVWPINEAANAIRWRRSHFRNEILAPQLSGQRTKLPRNTTSWPIERGSMQSSLTLILCLPLHGHWNRTALDLLEPARNTVVCKSRLLNKIRTLQHPGWPMKFPGLGFENRGYPTVLGKLGLIVIWQCMMTVNNGINSCRKTIGNPESSIREQ
jgi:hypothetical protein